MLLNTPSSSSVMSRLPTFVTELETAAGGRLSLVSGISILLEYPRFIGIRTVGANGARQESETAWSGAPDPDGSGAPVLPGGRLTGFDHVSDQGVAVPAILAYTVGRVGAVHEGHE